MLFSIGLGYSCIIVGECKEVLFACKSDGYDRPNKIGIDILIRLYCSWLGIAILLFLGFCPFIAIVDEFLCIIDEFNIMIYEMFFQRNEFEVAKSLVS